MTERATGQQPTSFYEEVGGRETFVRIVGRFYRLVAEDPLLRAMYPEADLSGAEERLRMFLEQYWGGPRTYSEQRGHPMLRRRHMPFRIDANARDRWLRHMRQAMDDEGLDPEHDQQLWAYFVMAADSLVNTVEEPPEAPGQRPNLLG